MTKRRYLKFAVPAAACLFLAGIPSAGLAQYSFNASNKDEEGIRFFGSAKDARGKRIPGAKIVITFGNSAFVFFTDETGRFRGTVGLHEPPRNAKISCTKRGLQPAKVLRRPGRATATGPTMQVDCLFRNA